MQCNVDLTTVNIVESIIKSKMYILCIFSYPAHPVYRAENLLWTLYHQTSLGGWIRATTKAMSHSWDPFLSGGERKKIPNHNLPSMPSPLHPYLHTGNFAPVYQWVLCLSLNPQKDSQTIMQPCVVLLGVFLEVFLADCLPPLSTVLYIDGRRRQRKA